MDTGEAHRYLYDRLDTDAGKYFSPGRSLDLGAGQLFRGIQFPLFDTDSSLYATAEGNVYVLSHECDIDQSNQRPFNEYVLIVPIISFEHWYEEFCRAYAHSPQIISSFLGRIARRQVSRLFYFPSVDHELPYGGLVYLNQITHAHISTFLNDQAGRICSVTAYGLEKFDQVLLQHLLRPKDNKLALIYR